MSPVVDPVSHGTVILIKIIVAVLLSIFLLVRLRGRRNSPQRGAGRLPRPSRSSLAFLVVLAVFSLVNFYNYGFFHNRYLNYGWLDKRAFLHLWEFYHYYTGAKYFEELGYHNLYNATIVADAEDGLRLARVVRIRDLGASGFISRDQILSRSREFKQRFSSRRWDEFKADVRYFTERLPPQVLTKMLIDHGYNPTPAWNTTGSFLANRISVDKLDYLALIDVAILFAIVASIGISYGAETALVATISFGISFFSGFPATGGAFLRYDWLLGLVLSLCFVRRRHYALAGAALAYATLVRIIPVFFLFGLVVKAVWETVRLRAFPEKYARFFLSFLLTSTLLFGYGCLTSRGFDAWKDFTGKITTHHRNLTGNSVGFKMVFLYEASWEDPISFAFEYGQSGEEVESVLNRAKGAEISRRRPMFLLYSLVVLTLSGLALLRVPDEEALAWGIVPIFMILNVSDYYYSFLVINAVVWYHGAGRRPYSFLLLSATHILVLWIQRSVDYSLFATALTSLVLFLFTLALIFSELSGNIDGLSRRLSSLRSLRS